jgi:hypothetical protein
MYHGLLLYEGFDIAPLRILRRILENVDYDGRSDSCRMEVESFVDELDP